MRLDEAFRLRKQVKALYRRLQREQPMIEGLSSTAVQVLVSAARAPKPMHPGQIAAELNLAQPNVAASLRLLEGKGMVRLVPDAGDRRKVLVEVLEEAAPVVARVSHAYDAWLQEACSRLLDVGEQGVLLEAGRLMARIVEQD